MKKILKWIGIVCVVFFLIGFITDLCISDEEHEQWKEQQRIEQTQKMYESFKEDSIKYCTKSPDIAYRSLEKFIINNLNDPESYKLYNYTANYHPNLNAYVLEVNYGGKNKFGTMVREKCISRVKVYCTFDTIDNTTKIQTDIESFNNI